MERSGSWWISNSSWATLMSFASFRPNISSWRFSNVTDFWVRNLHWNPKLLTTKCLTSLCGFWGTYLQTNIGLWESLIWRYTFSTGPFFIATVFNRANLKSAFLTLSQTSIGNVKLNWALKENNLLLSIVLVVFIGILIMVYYDPHITV